MPSFPAPTSADDAQRLLPDQPDDGVDQVDQQIDAGLAQRPVAENRAWGLTHFFTVIVLCKSHSTRAAARSVRHLVDGGAVVVSFQNGLGNEQVIAEELGTDNVLGGVTTMAAVKLAPGRIRDFARAPSTIGEMAGGESARTVTLSRALTAAGLETHASDDIVRDIWNKLLGNISLSAVSGIANLTSAGALQIPEEPGASAVDLSLTTMLRKC